MKYMRNCISPWMSCLWLGLKNLVTVDYLSMGYKIILESSVFYYMY